MNRIKCGFLATGSMGLSHVKLVREEFPGAAEITAVCDTHGPNLDKAKESAPEAKTYSDPEQLIADQNVEAIFISTPGFTHADFTAKCLKAKKHIFGEKPVMTTRQGVQDMVRLAEQHPDRVVLINHELRYSRYFQKVKDLIDAGEIGEPQLVWCKEYRGPFLKKVGDWIQDARYSGGCLVDKNCHHFDLMNWWIGSRPKRVCGFGGNDVVRVVGNEYEVIDHASVSFEFENGVRGGLLLCMFSPKLQEDLEMGVIGSEGMIQTRMSKDEIHQWKRGNSTADPIVHHVPSRKVGGGAHHGFIEAHAAFFNAIKEKQRPLTDVRDCWQGTMLAIAAEEAIANGTVVQV
ncbi:MAG TPA: Gfo/Idh/MocA family oxidoreductase [Tepidisphaeraceae bacterium]|nr:Gfo/Idh/MocA family oxidoreductase [Tepidisphaeraceae bacterium]